MKLNELKTFLCSTIPQHLPILIVGAPGVGKTDVVNEAARECGFDCFADYPSIKEPTDFGGLPLPAADGSISFRPYGVLRQVLESKKPCVYFLDELGQAMPAVQAAVMPWIRARSAHGHRLPDHVALVAATNRRTDAAAVSGMLAPVVSRFAAVVTLEPSLEDWCAWAAAHEINPMIQAFLRFRPDLLCESRPLSMDMQPIANPRTWAHLDALLRLDLPRVVETAAIQGCVGEGAGAEYIAFRAMAASLVTVEEILARPATAPIPTSTKAGELYAIAVALAARATSENFTSIVTYCERLRVAQHGEFAVLALRDATIRKPSLSRNPAFRNALCGELGALITGRGY